MTQKQLLEEAQTRVTELEGQIASANEKVSAFDAERTELNNKISTLEGEKSELSNQLTAANLKIDGFATQVTELTTRAETAEGKVTTLEGEAKSADERAREIAARAGVHLPKKDPKSIENVPGAKTVMSRADFSALKSGERMAFIKGGGRLTD